MKCLYVLFLLVAVPHFLAAQDSTIALSNYERYCTKPGKLLKTYTQYVSEIRSARVEVLKTNDIQTGDSISVVRITSILLGAPPLITPYNIYLERDQLDTVIKVLQYYSAELKKEDVKDFSYSYITGNDVSVSCSYRQGFFTNTWVTIQKVYQHLRTPVGTGFSFTKKDVDVLVNVLQTAQRAL